MAENSNTETDETTETDEGRSFAVEGNDLSGYVGVSPEYMTYANETEKPTLSDDDDALKLVQKSDEDARSVPSVPEEGAVVRPDEDPEDEGEPEKPAEQPTTPGEVPSSTPSATPSTSSTNVPKD